MEERDEGKISLCIVFDNYGERDRERVITTMSEKSFSPTV